MPFVLPLMTVLNYRHVFHWIYLFAELLLINAINLNLLCELVAVICTATTNYKPLHNFIIWFLMATCYAIVMKSVICLKLWCKLFEMWMNRFWIILKLELYKFFKTFFDIKVDNFYFNKRIFQILLQLSSCKKNILLLSACFLRCLFMYNCIQNIIKCNANDYLIEFSELCVSNNLHYGHTNK